MSFYVLMLYGTEQSCMDATVLETQLQTLSAHQEVSPIEWNTIGRQCLQLAQTLLNTQYNYQHAIIWFEHAIDVYEKQLSPTCSEDRSLAEQAYVGLAMSYHHIGKHVQRDGCMSKAQNLLGIPDTLDLYTRDAYQPHASAYFIVDGYRSYIRYEDCQRSSESTEQQCLYLQQAKVSFEKALEIALTFDEHSEEVTHAFQGLGTTCEFLGKCWLQQGNMNSAFAYIKQSINAFENGLKLREQLFGNEHPHTARSLHKLARNYVLMGYLLELQNDTQESRCLYQAADSLYKKACGIFDKANISKDHAKRQELEKEYEHFKKDPHSIIDSDSWEYNNSKCAR